MVNGDYLATRKFKYNGAELKRGDVWEPSGAENDLKIITSGLVRFMPDLSKKEEPEKPKRQRRTQNATK